MNDDHARLAQWDAAYVLGSLSSADRELYERHLAGCESCRVALAELAPLPGLLARVPQDRAEEVTGLSTAPPSGLPLRDDIVRIGVARARRARRRRRIAGIGAAAVFAAVIAVPVIAALAPANTQSVALEAIGDRPLSASVQLEEVPWGTRVDMTCRYESAAGATAGGWTYVLVVIADDGAETTLSTWRAFPDSTATVSAGTALRTDDIARFEVRAAKTGAVLLSGEPADIESG